MTAGLNPRSVPWQVCAGLGALSLAVLTGCAGGGGNASAGGASTAASPASQTLTIAVSGPPVSMDPSHADNGNGLYPMELTYEPLIWENDNGSLSPGLATSWRYVGTGNKTFELTIRSGAKFADGEPVTPQAVANSRTATPRPAPRFICSRDCTSQPASAIWRSIVIRPRSSGWKSVASEPAANIRRWWPVFDANKFSQFGRSR